MNFIKKMTLTLIGATIIATNGIAQSVQHTTQGITYTTQEIDVKVEFYSPTIVRIYKTPIKKPYKKESLVIIKTPETTSVTFGEKGKNVTLSSNVIQVEVNPETGGIRFSDKEGKLLLTDKDYGTQFTPFDDAGVPSYNVRQAFLLDKDEVIYGLGQQQTGKVNQRNQKLFLRNQNMSICIPFIHSIKGYALYWDNYSPTTFVDNPQEMSFDSEVGDCADYYFIYGGNADKVIANVRELTGQAPLYPLWALGFWQCRERYKSPDELCEVVDKYRKLKVPLDGIIQDWQYWGCDSNWNAMKFQNPRYINKMGDKEYMKYLPNGEDKSARYGTPRIKTPKEMIDYVHKQNAHIMISVWPKFYYTTEHYKELDALGAMYQQAIKDSIRDWIYPGYIGSFYDAYNPEARKLFWEQMNEHLYSLGIDAWWMDASEPNVQDNTDIEYRKALCGPTYLGPSTKYFNAYALENAEAIYDGQRSVNPDDRVFLLTRSGFAGQQRYSTATWSGDIGTRWEDMKAQISAGLNFAMSGIPYWTMDIGGFSVENRYMAAKEGSEDLREWRELNNRWYQFGAFCPLFRSHGQYPCREIYNIAPEGSPTYQSMKYYTELRYQLMPYIYSLASKTHFEDYTIMRAMVMDYSNDEKTYDIDDQFMFGPAFMACPVHKYKARERKVYFPSGVWYDFYSGKCIQGGTAMDVDAPYERMPLFVRAGSIVPTGKVIQSTKEEQKDLTVSVYAGADGSFTLYEDNGVTYDYEKGNYATIPFVYDDARRTLTIGAREGDYPGMIRERQITVRLITPENPSGKDVTISYQGKPLVVEMGHAPSQPL